MRFQVLCRVVLLKYRMFTKTNKTFGWNDVSQIFLNEKRQKHAQRNNFHSTQYKETSKIDMEGSEVTSHFWITTIN